MTSERCAHGGCRVVAECERADSWSRASRRAPASRALPAAEWRAAARARGAAMTCVPGAATLWAHFHSLSSLTAQRGSHRDGTRHCVTRDPPEPGRDAQRHCHVGATSSSASRLAAGAPMPRPPETHSGERLQTSHLSLNARVGPECVPTLCGCPAAERLCSEASGYVRPTEDDRSRPMSQRSPKSLPDRLRTVTPLAGHTRTHRPKARSLDDDKRRRAGSSEPRRFQGGGLGRDLRPSIGRLVPGLVVEMVRTAWTRHYLVALTHHG